MHLVVAITRVMLSVFSGVLGLILVLPVLVLGLPFWIVAFVTRSLPVLFESRHVPWQDLMEFDSTIGWKPKANLDTHYLASSDDVFHIVTDSHGWPGNRSIAESKIVVFGDSVAFSYGVNICDSFVALNPGLGIKGIGAPGYNLVQELLLMEQMSSQLKGKLVVWFIFLENDLYGNLMPNLQTYQSPFIRRVNGNGEWELVNDHLNGKDWHHTSGHFYYDALASFCAPTLLSERAYSACEYLIRAGGDVCRRAGAELAVLTIPSTKQLNEKGLKALLSYGAVDGSIDPDYPDKQIRRICRKCGVSFVAGKKYLNRGHYKKFESVHWNERGHRRVARLLEKVYHAYRLGKLESFL